MKTKAFPLQWPKGYPVTENRKASLFDCTLPQARDGIYYQIRLLAGEKNSKEAIISTNMSQKKGQLLGDGVMMYPNPGAAVYFTFEDEDKVIACDAWETLHENLRAIEKTIEAMRGLDRWKCTDILSRAMSDMKALPMQAGAGNGTSWWEILGVPIDASADDVKDAYRLKVRYYHPDNPHTGNRTMFDLVQHAYQEGLEKFEMR